MHILIVPRVLCADFGHGSIISPRKNAQWIFRVAFTGTSICETDADRARVDVDVHKQRWCQTERG